jgi:hypothetical protein
MMFRLLRPMFRWRSRLALWEFQQPFLRVLLGFARLD